MKINAKGQDVSNKSLQERKDKVMARGLGNLASVYIKSARNSELWDVEDNRYIDFGSGIAVNNTGHAHPKVNAAVKKQLDEFIHSAIIITPYEAAISLAEKLVEIAPGDSDKKAILVTTGAEAVENCIKVARAYTRRRGIIAFDGGFHGRTNMTMGLTGKIMPYKHRFGPFPNDIYHVPFPIEYLGISAQASLDALHNLFKTSVVPEDIAAIVIEPIQGEGGFYAAPAEFLTALRNLCDQHGIVLIADEVQSGFGRTGNMFYMDQTGVEPDLITMAKGIAGGFPLAAVVGKSEIMDAPIPGGLGGTYAGSPISCIAALEVIKIIDDEGLIARANEIGQQFKQFLESMQTTNDSIGDVRVHGAMIAMELVKNGDVNQPDVDLTNRIVNEAYQQGLVLINCGVRSNVIRFLPPLTISDELIKEGLQIVREIMTGFKLQSQ